MEYLDLGLPSGTLWAAENETDNGGYFTYDEAVAKFWDNLPTKADFEELITHCWKRWDNERKGLDFLSDNGTKLFLPASGYRGVSDVNNVRHIGYYWSATHYGSCNAFLLCFDSKLADIDKFYRNHRRAVRLIKRGGEQ